MTREIKYRVWDETTGKFRDLAVYDVKNEKVVVRFPIETLKKGEYQLEQYTGLKDKNGKEIYEGDIVKVTKWVNDENLGYEEFVHTAKISWRGRYAQFGTDYSDNLSDEITEDFFEVIGNIHENPELLEGKNE